MLVAWVIVLQYRVRVGHGKSILSLNLDVGHRQEAHGNNFLNQKMQELPETNDHFHMESPGKL